MAEQKSERGERVLAIHGTTSELINLGQFGAFITLSSIEKAEAPVYKTGPKELDMFLDKRGGAVVVMKFKDAHGKPHEFRKHIATLGSYEVEPS